MTRAHQRDLAVAFASHSGRLGLATCEVGITVVAGQDNSEYSLTGRPEKL